MSLKWSMSMNSTAHIAASRRARPIARTTASSSARRFAARSAGQSTPRSHLFVTARVGDSHGALVGEELDGLNMGAVGEQPFTGSSTEMRPSTSPSVSAIWHRQHVILVPLAIRPLFVDGWRVQLVLELRRHPEPAMVEEYERLRSISGCMTGANSSRVTVLARSCLVSDS